MSNEYLFNEQQRQALDEVQRALNNLHTAFHPEPTRFTIVMNLAIRVEEVEAESSEFHAVMMVGQDQRVAETAREVVHAMAQKFWNCAEAVPLDLLSVINSRGESDAIDVFMQSIYRHIQEGNEARAARLVEKFPETSPEDSRTLAIRIDPRGNACEKPDCLSCRTRRLLWNLLVERSRNLTA